MKIFRDRQSAGNILAKRLESFKADFVLGIPRGGVVVAAEIAKDLNLPLDIVVTRKIGAPGQAELALGAVDPDGAVVWDHQLLKQLEFKIKNLKFKIEEAKKETKRREELYRGKMAALEVAGKKVILVDDGIATGATVLSALKFLRSHGARVILAVPVASKEALEKINDECKEVIILETPAYFGAVGQFYQQFEPVTDEEVVELLNGREVLKNS